MSDLETVAKFLAESVIASTAKTSERNLRQLETQDGFGLTLLLVIASHKPAVIHQISRCFVLQKISSSASG
ncbi:BFH_HP2_G0017630.mRNA.1.CDS.1 [Saccharomyces cerevisiae]|nr:BFH_HP2_G0017630.mRNA.1.CDS.1 [Saccharomyces cerevisiae]CAI6499153.1 BFH_HP2_G0017630.mRNA.1.CDS.1 [Saccharomyces cerevisiae]